MHISLEYLLPEAALWLRLAEIPSSISTSGRTLYVCAMATPVVIPLSLVSFARPTTLPMAAPLLVDTIPMRQHMAVSKLLLFHIL